MAGESCVLIVYRSLDAVFILEGVAEERHLSLSWSLDENLLLHRPTMTLWRCSLLYHITFFEKGAKTYKGLLARGADYNTC
jgi:hypothetical protein